MSEAALETTDEHEPEAHEEGTNQEQRATTPAIDVDVSWDSEGDVEDVLNGICDQVAATAGKTSTLEDVDDVVPIHLISTLLAVTSSRPTS